MAADRGVDVLRIKNFRSIQAAEIRLAPFVVFVGPNGSGKSNVLAALGFVASAMSMPLEQAVRANGGIATLRRRAGGAGQPPLFGISLDLHLAHDRVAFYGFELKAVAGRDFVIRRERCVVAEPGHPPTGFDRDGTELVAFGRLQDRPKPGFTPRSLVMVPWSGDPDLAPVHEALASMRIHAIAPDAVRALQAPDAGAQLSRDGGNLASVLRALQESNHGVLGRISGVLAHAVPGLVGVRAADYGPSVGVRFTHQGDPGARAQTFTLEAAAESDGTLRLLGILTAAAVSRGALPPPLALGIEEPEAAIHLGAFGILLDALRDAGEAVQVLVTSHSADLLDVAPIEPEAVRVVLRRPGGATTVSPLTPKTIATMREHLVARGDFLRSGGDQAMVVPAPPSVDLFAGTRAAAR